MNNYKSALYNKTVRSFAARVARTLRVFMMKKYRMDNRTVDRGVTQSDATAAPLVTRPSRISFDAVLCG